MKVATDGFCLTNAILLQIVHHPDFDAAMANKMAGVHMIRNPHKFYKLLEYELQRTGESYESYCYNVFHSNQWGDDVLGAVYADMWNLTVSIVSPLFKSRIDLFHTSDNPDIVLIANGGSYMASQNASTHFSATRCITEGYRKPGTDLVNTKPGIAPEVVYKQLKPVPVTDVVKAKKLAIEEYSKAEKEKSLELLYMMNKQIMRCDDEIAKAIRISDKMKSEKRRFEFQMEQMEISHEKIKAASLAKELPYMLTEEREREEIRQERKRKYAEEEDEEKRKKRKITATKDGKPIETEETESEKPSEGETSGDHNSKLIEQLQAMLKTQENVVQQQEAALIASQMRVRQLEMEKNQQLSNPTQTILPSIPTYSGMSEFDDLNLQNLDTEVVDVIQTPDVSVQGQLQQSLNMPTTSSDSTRKTGAWSLHNLIKPEHWKFLPSMQAAVKKEPSTTEVETSLQVDSSALQQIVQVDNPAVMEVLTLPGSSSTETTVYIAKSSDSKKKKLVLIPAESRKTSGGKRHNPGAPVSVELRDPKRHYCENCSSHYSKKEDLTKHVRNVCGKTVHDYLCEKCQKGFHTDFGVREHYYKLHLNTFLYHCEFCDKGFYFKSKKSNHKKVCLNKDGEKKFRGKVEVDAELEKTFQRRKLVEIDTDKERSEDSEEDEEEKEEKEKEKEKEEEEKEEEEKEKGSETEKAVQSITPEKKRKVLDDDDED